MISLKNSNFTFDFIYLFLLVFIGNILYLYLVNFIYDKPFVDDEDFSKLTIGTLIAYVFVVPLIEELCFRGILNLSKNSIVFVVISISIVIYLYFKLTLLTLIITSIILIFGIWSLFSTKLVFCINSLIEGNVTFFIITSSLLFSLFHIKNYETYNTESFLKVIPRFTGGFIWVI